MSWTLYIKRDRCWREIKPSLTRNNMSLESDGEDEARARGRDDNNDDEAEHVREADSDLRFPELFREVKRICVEKKWNKDRVLDAEGEFSSLNGVRPRKHLIELIVNTFGREEARVLNRFRNVLEDGDDEVIRRKIKKALNLHRWELQRAEWEEEERRNPRSKAWKYEERKEREMPREKEEVMPRNPYRGGDRTKHTKRGNK